MVGIHEPDDVRLNAWHTNVECPRCGRPYLGDVMRRERTCASCGTPFGYLPAAEDLDAEAESSP
jgi:uncharacterized protein (DUF983 family)